MDKRVLTLIIIFAVIALALILCATVFLLRHIEVGYTTSGEENILSEDKIIAASGLKINKNVLFIKEKQIIVNIQAKYPQVKVTNVERVFPNKVIIYVTVRVPVLAVKAGEKYALLDREMFVIDLVDETELKNKSEGYGYEFLTVDFTLPSGKVIVGKQVSADVSKELCVVQNVIAGYENLDFVNQDVCSFIKRIEIVETVYSEGDYIAKIFTVTGVEFRLPSVNLGKMLSGSYKWYSDTSVSSDVSDAKKLNGGF
ncbi:MAG: FtsQ-type POTRA domain-containing protein, partial [Acidaminococcus sp.]|nr:FtsQ-type POTRA domain-containing protein [Acidaminococcus sp.]